MKKDSSGSSDSPPRHTVHRHSISTAQEGARDQHHSQGSRSPKQRPKHWQPIEGASLKQATGDKADPRSRSQNTGSVPTKIPSRLVPPCIMETDMADAKTLPTHFPQDSRSFIYAWRLAAPSCPALCLGTLHSNTTYFTFRALLTEQKLQTMNLWKTQQLKTGKSKVKRGPSRK